MRKSFKRSIAVAAALALMLAAAAAALAWRVPLPKRLALAHSRVIEFDDGTPMRAFLSPDDKWRVPVLLSEVDPDFIEALLAFEDERFSRHPGVDPIAIARALLQNLKAGKIVSGASTITMQLVRILEPRPRTFSSKILEALRALQLELYFDKPDLLRLYLQFAPYGKNYEGVESATLAFFGHSARELSPFEIAYLIGVPQRPSTRYPRPDRVEVLTNLSHRIARRLHQAGAFDDRELELALAGSPPAELRRFPRQALHVASFLEARTGEPRVRSFINPDAQRLAENALQKYRRELSELGVFNGSVVVVEIETGRVVAAVGNFDFWDEARQGQVVGFLAPRSPGSALKPFIYALAIDRGVALPDYLVLDAPIDYKGYKPINYDRRYRGLVRLDDALSQSLNLPFVGLLSELGVGEYLSFLGQGGVTTIAAERERYGLSLAVGGVEIRPVDLVNLYAMLARHGEWRPLLWRQGQEAGAPVQLLSPAACRLTRAALQRRDRPDFPGRDVARATPQAVFWKTGTSAFHRDAWAVGAAGGYAAVVWLGNFEGQGARELVGADRAGPILFDALEGMTKLSGKTEAALPDDDLAELVVCAFSGRPAAPSCPETKIVLAPRQNLPTAVCPYHFSAIIDVATGLRLNPLCAAGRETVTQTFTSLPPALARWIGDQKLGAPGQVPPLHPACNAASAAARPPAINYPRSGAVFFLVPGMKPDDQEIRLEAQATAEAGALHWFVDGVFIGEAAADQRMWLVPTLGDHEIRVSDRSGRGQSVRIKVMTPG